MKVYWGVEVQLHTFLTPALDGGEWSASLAGRFTPWERVGYINLGITYFVCVCTLQERIPTRFTRRCKVSAKGVRHDMTSLLPVV
jgi:hypothetical protein